MKFKTTMGILSLYTSSALSANQEISYSWVEANYQTNKPGIYVSDQAYELGFSVDLSNSFYLKANASKTQDGDDNPFINTENTYGLSLGYHYSMSDSTDIYAELGYSKIDPSGDVPLPGGGLEGGEYRVGTRTAFSSKFELITSVGYNDVDIENSLPRTVGNSMGGVNFSVSGLYRLSDYSQIHLGLFTEDSITTPILGYRFNW